MTDHMTHFDDCGCLAAQHAAEIAKALAERDVAKSFHDLAIADRNLAWAQVAAASELLAVIFRDGGQAINRMGFTGACDEAQDVVVELRRENDRLCQENVEWQDRSLENMVKAEEALAERDAAQADYARLTGLLRARFPMTADGSLPDWKVEDVLVENAALREQKKYAAEECVRVSNENVRLREALESISTAAAKAERARIIAELRRRHGDEVVPGSRTPNMNSFERGQDAAATWWLAQLDQMEQP